MIYLLKQRGRRASAYCAAAKLTLLAELSDQYPDIPRNLDGAVDYLQRHGARVYVWELDQHARAAARSERLPQVAREALEGLLKRNQEARER